MKSYRNLGRFGALLVLALGACEVLIMISPFAGFFYASVHFEPLLGFLSASPLTAWLDGFFLNHSVVTSSALIEGQRKIGQYIFAAGLWGFFISAFQVYGNKMLKRGVAKGLLYRFSRHPQYLCLGVAGWGLLTIWPRFLLLGIWVTMLFLYAGLSRFEAWRMEERCGDAYRQYTAGKGAFLPGNPIRRIFQVTFARIRPRAVGWAAAYVFCLVLAFSGGFLLRSQTRAATAFQMRPDYQAVVISAWPQSPEWLRKVLDTAMADEKVKEQLMARGDLPLVATVLPPRYRMKGMFYKMGPEPPQSEESSDELTDRSAGGSANGPTGRSTNESPESSGESGNESPGGSGNESTNGSEGRGGLIRVARIAVAFLAPFTRPQDFMGVDPDSSDAPVEVVISRAEKPYKEGLLLEEALDASVRRTPLVVVEVQPNEGKIVNVKVPLPQNNWGPKVVMPLL